MQFVYYVIVCRAVKMPLMLNCNVCVCVFCVCVCVCVCFLCYYLKPGIIRIAGVVVGCGCMHLVMMHTDSAFA